MASNSRRNYPFSRAKARSGVLEDVKSVEAASSCLRHERRHSGDKPKSARKRCIGDLSQRLAAGQPIPNGFFSKLWRI